MIDKNDWRLTNQENYLKNKELYHRNYKKTGSFDHDHCSFCFTNFKSNEQVGYCTTNYYHWICEECYKDFKNSFNWRVIEEDKILQ
jgi:hypothetical protein